MSTVLSLLNQVLTRTGQTTVSNVSTLSNPARQALAFLNEAYTETLQSLNIKRLNQEATFSTQANISTYPVAADANPEFIAGDSLWLVNEGLRVQEVSRSHTHELDKEQTGRPAFFWLSDTDQFVLWPKPDSTYTVRYTHGVKPQSLTSDSQQTLLPIEWERVVIKGAQAYLERFLGEKSHQTSYVEYRQAQGQLKAQLGQSPRPRIRGAYQGYNR